MRANSWNGSGGDAAQRRNSGTRAAGAPTDADAASTARDDDDAADGEGEPARNPSANTDLRDLWEPNPDLVTEMRDNVTEAERRLYDVCSGHIEQNDGRELHGGIDPDLDEQHKGWYDDVTASGYNLYDCPNSAISRRRLGVVLARVKRIPAVGAAFPLIVTEVARPAPYLIGRRDFEHNKGAVDRACCGLVGCVSSG